MSLNLFDHSCDTLEGLNVACTGEEAGVYVRDGHIVMLDESSFADANIGCQVGSIPSEYTLSMRIRLARVVDPMIDPCDSGCEVVWCLQCIYLGNASGNSFSVAFSKKGVWAYFNPTDRFAGPGGNWWQVPDTARFIDDSWHDWTFHVVGRDSIEDDFVDIWRDGDLIARRVRIHNHENPDGGLWIANRGVECNPAEMHIGGISITAAHEEKQA
ncbi:MAG: hypothetical protein ACYC64_10010 [Armatimonadota bacterium]